VTVTATSIPLRVLVCDDELLARKRAVRLVTELLSPDQVESCASGQEALDLVQRDDFDLVLLDVDMPGMNGIEVARALPEPAPQIVFLTAHSEHALSAFNVGAVDYLVKPLESERLQKTLERVSKRLHEAHRPEAVRSAAKPSAKLAIAEKGGVTLLDPETICACVLEDALVTLYISTGATVLSAMSLAELHAKLPHLERVHRKSLLNLDLVTRLESLPSGGYLAVAQGGGGARVEISRQAARLLRKRFGIA
jgi:two-component system, LytTR family, response regulator